MNRIYINGKEKNYMQLLYATSNESKICNMRYRLKGYEIALVTPKEIGIHIDVEENGPTPIENARLKAKAYYEKMSSRRELFREQTRTRKALHLTLVTTYPLSHTQYSEMIPSIVTLDDLFVD